MTALAGLARHTERVRLGTLVLGAPFRHPVLLAKAAVAIDRLSGGRLDLGIGAGWLEPEFTAFGYRFGTVSERFEQLEAQLRVMRALGRGEPASTEDGPYRLREAMLVPSPIQDPHVPLWLGAKGGDRALRLAASYADGWNTVWRWDPDAYADRVAAAGAACERAGRDPGTLRLSVGLYSLVAEDEPGFKRSFERGQTAMPGRALDGETPDDWRADTLSGTPEQVLERIDAFAAIGVEELIVSPWVLPFVLHDPEQLPLFAERVIAPHRAVS
jgi:alkanesulfonate monooxygenase SsuD/methylene tetrahydromethanopterin reductase-like flavin-dependent oxidoreductase (luciferase family)